MRDSFVFHSSYIEFLPENAKARFTQYIIEYGLYGKEPPIEKETFEYTVWIERKNRIDAEAAKYQEISEKRKAAAQKRYEKYYKTETKSENQKEVVNQSEKTEKQNKKFEKPTVQEIEEYCNERKNKINANQFYDFYESKDWKVGNQKMKDWKACIRTWEVRKKDENNNGKSKGLIGNENDIPDEYLNLM